MFFATLLVLTAVIGFLNRWLLIKANKKIWDKRYLKSSAQFLPYLVLFFSLFWWLGTAQNIWWIRTFGATGTSISLILNLLLLLSLPVSLLSNTLFKFFIKKKTNRETNPNPSRRLFLKTAAASFPVVALGSTASGLASSFSRTSFPQISVSYPNLPPALDGFKILHLSDLHLGYYFDLNNLEQTLADAEKYQVHMVVVTGDIADNLNLMTDATKLIDQLKTPFDKFISIGNHEYFRGIHKSIRKIEAGPIELLLNKHHTMDIHGTKLVIGGADDPVSLRADIHGFLDQSMSETFKDAPESDFKMLMSHRPRALDLAQKHGVDLTLSGHTHGGQVGLGGRSFWEIFNENGYLWGLYKNGQSKLYTSAGMGHWFPFRLNCPLEAPVITLKKVKSA